MTVDIPGIYNNLLKKNKSEFSYVLLTILTTLVRFFKGFVLMRYLSLKELGIITLIGAVMGLFSMLQLGFLNGGYRIFSEQHKERSSVNDIVYSYFFVIEIAVLIGIVVMYYSGRINGIEVIYALLASVFGILLVLNNWIRNMLIAAKRVAEVNRLNLSSTLISFIFLLTVPFWKLYGALLVTFSIELLFFVTAIWRSRELLPKKFNYNLKQYKWVLSFGFLPFISAIILTYNDQIETWSIASFISTEALGEFYLPKLYISLFLLVPTAVCQLFYPDAVMAYKNSNYVKFKLVLKKYFAINIVISLFLLLITILFIRPVIGFVVPLHLVGIPYIWYILPGLILYTILQPMDLIFYSSNILKPFLWSSIIAVCFTTAGLLSSGFMGDLSLKYVAIIKGIFYAITCLSILNFYFIKRKTIWKERDSACFPDNATN